MADPMDQIAADLATIYGETMPQSTPAADDTAPSAPNADRAARIAALAAELAALQVEHAEANPPAPAAAPAIGGVDADGLYTVRPGDSLESIAAACGVDPDALYRANQQAGRLIVRDSLTTGAQLVIPAAANAL